MDISSLLEVEVKEGKASDLHSNGEIADYKNIPDFSIRVPTIGDVVTYNRKLLTTISHDERHYYKLIFGSDIASVRFRKLHCTACDIHIGSAPAEAHNMHEHPVLHVLLCTNCRNFYGDGTFEQGDDATDMFCRWCANGGNLYCCSYCSNTFCYACIKRNFDPLVRKKIERDEKWKCFVCNPADLYSARASCWALLQHVQTVTRILQTDRKMSPAEIEAKMNLDESQCCPHKSKRKRSDTPTEDDEDDETYTVPKRKRRKILNARRPKRRLIKLEMADPSAEGVTAEPENPHQSNSNHGRTEEIFFVESSENQSKSRIGKDQTSVNLPLTLRKSGRRHRSGSSSRLTNIERSKYSMQDDDIPVPLLQCDQSMIEGAESLSFDGSSPGSQGAGSSASRIGITPVPTVNLLKKPVAGPAIHGGKDHRIVRNLSGASIYVRKLPGPPPNMPQPGGNAKTTGVQSLPMVSILSRNPVPQTPNRMNVIQPSTQASDLVRNATGGLYRQIRPRIVLAKPISNPNINKNPRNQPPSIIDLDSDEDDPVIVVESSKEQRTQESNDRVPELSTTTYPVRPDDGLMTILCSKAKKHVENSEKGKEEEPGQRPKESTNAFELAIRGPTKSIDDVLDTLKNKLKKVLESAMIFSPNKELVAAKAKTRAVNRTIKRTVTELTSLSSNLISAYQAFKRKCNNKRIVHTPLITLEKKEKSKKIITLDMQCTKESDPESDEIASDEDSDSSQDIQPVREIRPFKRRVSRAINVKPQTENKSVQVYDVVTRDYEKSIGYALLLKADYDPKRERDILRSVMVPDENFGKYEEEFINYLQYIEDSRNKRDIMEEDDSAIISVNDLVEADISTAIVASEMPEMITSSNKTVEEEKQNNNDENVEIFDEHLEISITTAAAHSSSSSSNSNSSSSDSETGNSEVALPRKKKLKKNSRDNTIEKEVAEAEGPETENKEKKDETSSKDPKARSRATDEETVLAVRALIEDDSSENSNSNAALKSWKPIESDDECTVLD